MRTKMGGIAAIAILGMILGCGQNTSDDEAPEVEEEETGIALGVGVQDNTDVDGFRFVIQECDQGAVAVDEIHSLEQLLLPGALGEVENRLFDEGSEHLFADHFEVLSAGCYDVDVQPVTASGDPSQQCEPASAEEVFVVNGKTTEILLVSQCHSPQMGSVDSIAALNNPPVIESVDYSPSKFTYECEDVEICVTAYDPDSDPMEFVFEQTAGDKLRFPLEFTEPTVKGDRATACMQAVPVFNDDYEFTVSVYDQVWDGDEPVRIEDYVGLKSRAELSFPMYTNWDFELECYDPETGDFHPFIGTREIERVQPCEPIWPHQFFCSDFHWNETDRTCPEGEFKPETVYPLCQDHEGQYEVR